MSRDAIDEEIRAVEALLYVKFCTEPFHNVFMLNDIHNYPTTLGGTCSDKTLSFIAAARAAGHTASLHTAYINGEEIHRLARLTLGGRVFFADAGNGWPSLKLYPADQPIHVRCFGMGYRTEITERQVRVYHRKRTEEVLQLEIDTRVRSEQSILADIKRRFNSGIRYPFKQSFRFSQIVGNRFLFMRGDTVEIYGEHGFETAVEVGDRAKALATYFNADLGQYLDPQRS